MWYWLRRGPPKIAPTTEQRRWRCLVQNVQRSGQQRILRRYNSVEDLTSGEQNGRRRRARTSDLYPANGAYKERALRFPRPFHVGNPTSIRSSCAPERGLRVLRRIVKDLASKLVRCAAQTSWALFSERRLKRKT